MKYLFSEIFCLLFLQCNGKLPFVSGPGGVSQYYKACFVCGIKGLFVFQHLVYFECGRPAFERDVGDLKAGRFSGRLLPEQKRGNIVYSVAGNTLRHIRKYRGQLNGQWCFRGYIKFFEPFLMAGGLNKVEPMCSSVMERLSMVLKRSCELIIDVFIRPCSPIVLVPDLVLFTLTHVPSPVERIALRNSVFIKSLTELILNIAGSRSCGPVRLTPVSRDHIMDPVLS